MNLIVLKLLLLVLVTKCVNGQSDIDSKLEKDQRFRGPDNMILREPEIEDEEENADDAVEDSQKTFWSYKHILEQDTKCREKDLLSCSVDCDHHKIYKKHGCCKCVCYKNYFLVGSTQCRRASWSKWSHWSKCIKSKWGGLQTRERVCRSRGREKPGVCNGRGSISRTCSSVTEDFRIRKNVHQLTDEELHDLIQAMTKLKQDGSKKGYLNIASWHGFPGRCSWNKMYKEHEDHHCSWHHHPLFLPWHRLITVQFELGLQRYLKNKTLGIPYWDWAGKSLDIPYIIRHPQIFDPILKEYVDNPFHGTYILDRNHTHTRRNMWYPGLLIEHFFQRATTRALLSHNYFNFDNIISTYSHDQIHNCFCYEPLRKHDPPDWCDYGMPTTTYASFDPAFLLHHSAMDRVFSMRRRLEEDAGLSDWTSSRVTSEYVEALQSSSSISNPIKYSFQWPLSPFCNKTMNPEPTTRKNKVWTLHRSYYGEQLFGYKYADFNLGDYSWEDLKKDYKFNNLERRFWNDDIFDTKIGKLGSKICKNPIYYKKAACYLSC